jgi:hypothetical protein
MPLTRLSWGTLFKGNKFLRGVVNGWQLSGITQLQSGVNLSATLRARTSMQPAISALHCTSTMHTTPPSLVLFDQWNGPGAAHAADHVQSHGESRTEPVCERQLFHDFDDAGVNGPIVLPEIFGPWFFNSDLSMFKNFQISESKKLQFRFSAYNFLNHPIWSFTGTGVRARIALTWISVPARAADRR